MKQSTEGWLSDFDCIKDPTRDISKHFKLQEGVLGKGASSQVLTCVHCQTGEAFACKRVNKRKLNMMFARFNMDPVECMRTEIRNSVSLVHRHIIDVVDIFETSKDLLVCMELMEGGTLFEYVIEIESLRESEAAGILRQVGLALSYMHDKGVIHRDVKVENVMLKKKYVAGDGQMPLVKLVDFGLSKKMTVDSKDVRCQDCVGTPGYRAPEVGVAETYTASVDMFSFGVTCYVLLCGYLPLYSETADDGGTSGSLLFPEDEWSDISGPAMDLIRKLTASDPTARITAKQAIAHPWLQSSERPARKNPLLKSSANFKNPPSKEDLRYKKAHDFDVGKSRTLESASSGMATAVVRTPGFPGHQERRSLCKTSTLPPGFGRANPELRDFLKLNSVKLNSSLRLPPLVVPKPLVKAESGSSVKSGSSVTC